MIYNSNDVMAYYYYVALSVCILNYIILQIFIYDFKWLTCQEEVSFNQRIEEILQPALIK